MQAGYFTLANAYHRKGEDNKAFEYYTNTLSLPEPYSSRSHKMIGLIYLEKDDEEKALIHLKKAFENNKLLFEELVEALALDHMQMLEKVVGLADMTGKQKIMFYSQTANNLIRKKEFFSAEKLFLNLLSIEPSYIAAYVNLGNIYSLDVKTHYKAVKYYKKGLTYDKQNEVLLHNLADTYMKLKKYSKGISIITNTLIKNNPENPQYHMMAAYALKMMDPDKYREAIRTYANRAKELEFILRSRQRMQQ
ncbi:tetratricopeptide repeat protein [Spirochaetota bacterium]